MPKKNKRETGFYTIQSPGIKREKNIITEQNIRAAVKKFAQKHIRDTFEQTLQRHKVSPFEPITEDDDQKVQHVKRHIGNVPTPLAMLISKDAGTLTESEIEDSQQKIREIFNAHVSAICKDTFRSLRGKSRRAVSAR